MSTDMNRSIPLTVRGLDGTIIERLKERARGRRRSLEAELRAILTDAARQPLVLNPLAEADRVAALTPRCVERIERVQRRPLPAAGGPR